MTDPAEMTASDKMLARIRKLLTQAEDPAATTGEAEAFTAKAAELMAAYGVDRAMLAADDPSSDVLGDKVVVVPGPYAMGRAGLLGAIAHALGVRTVRKVKSQGSLRARQLAGAQEIHLFGFASDLQRVDILFTSLLLQCHTSQIRDERAGLMPWYATPKVWRRDYITGFAVRVGARLAEAEKRARADYDRAHVSGPGTALVLVERSALVDTRVGQVYPSLRSGTPRAVGAGFGQGQAAGNRADLGAARLGGSQRQLGR